MAEKVLSWTTEDLDRSFGEKLEIHILPALEQPLVGGSRNHFVLDSLLFPKGSHTFPVAERL